jgi:hypothetical protein
MNLFDFNRCCRIAFIQCRPLDGPILSWDCGGYSNCTGLFNDHDWFWPAYAEGHVGVSKHCNVDQQSHCLSKHSQLQCPSDSGDQCPSLLDPFRDAQCTKAWDCRTCLNLHCSMFAYSHLQVCWQFLENIELIEKYGHRQNYCTQSCISRNTAWIEMVVEGKLYCFLMAISSCNYIWTIFSVWWVVDEARGDPVFFNTQNDIVKLWHQMSSYEQNCREKAVHFFKG